MASLLDMNRTEKEQYVIQLYNENKSTREIAKLMHMSFRDIGTIIKKAKSGADQGRGPLEIDDIKSKSKTTQAIKLFSELSTPVEVAIALDLPSAQVEAIYQEYWELEGMYRLVQIYDEAKYDLHDLLALLRTVKRLGMEKHDIKNVLEIAKNNQLEYLQSEVKYLKNEISMLETRYTNRLFRLKKMKHRMIAEYEETLAQKRAEMAYVNRESIKSRRRIVEYNTNNLQPITHSEPNTNSHSTQILPYDNQ